MTPAWLTPLASASDLPQLSSALTLPGRVDLAGLAGVARALLPLLLTDMRLLVVTPHEHDIETLTADLTTLARELEQDGPVLSLPSPGPPPYHDLPRHPEASLRRAVALRQAARCRAIVTSPAALLRPVIAPHLFATRVLTLKQGEDMLLELLLEALAEGGYRHEDPVTTTGQMARRGGIVDVFTPDAEHPVRIEFNGDTIESLRPFDIETQRSLGTLAGIEIAPLSDVFLPRSAVAHLQAVLPERCAHAPEAQWLLKDLARGVITDTAQELLVWVPEATVPAWAYFKDACLVAIEPDVIRHEAVTF
ncbi:MAG: hypothetical protein MUF51_06270, partial [Vicinamibacteria bacterium]|nr:hypothetical protein [Vicinamibacteria bacterium]